MSARKAATARAAMVDAWRSAAPGRVLATGEWRIAAGVRSGTIAASPQGVQQVSKALVVAPKSHAELGASSASRWWACPGSVRLTRDMPDTGGGSVYANEGTAAHAVGEKALRNGVDPVVYLGSTIAGVEVTDDMIENVRIYVDYCNELRQRMNVCWIEQQFSLAALNPPAPMFGTGDFAGYDRPVRVLHIVDYKHGAGVVVEVFENKQLLYYALGVLLAVWEECKDVENIRITIVQPRAGHRDGIIRHFDISLVDLLGFANELLAAARRTQEPDAPLVPGPQCRFCRASGICPAQRKAAEEVAMVEFSSLPLDLPPDPELVPLAKLAEWYEQFHVLDAWMNSVKGRLQGSLERGEEVPGLKLVARRANRSWVEEREVIAWLRAKGLKEDEIFKMKLQSPAGIEKVIGKKGLPEDLTQKVSSGYNMVAASDPRPAVQVEPGSEFTAITDGQGD